ncbi:hypothetical protein [Lichenibacterium dinghuense]|uniref:hypothetical protein n=1 Tax=Lichenibacterium dinghuense TaxID=2895977 RepID=UPI001F2B1131|nr:hypothetical protein [Lichenibacterium sp. 6Y81]
MVDGRSNGTGAERPLASRAEFDALGEIIAATIAMAARTRSAAATALLERALETLDERVRTMGGQKDDGPQSGLRPS